MAEPETREPVQAQTREFVANQLGYQMLAMCELNATIAHLRQQLDAVTKERDELHAKAGARV